MTAERIELTLTLARTCARDLLPEAEKRPAITPENFAECAPLLLAAAPELFQIAAAGNPLALTSAEVAISGDADITFKLVYPRPAAGPLRFFAYYVVQLIDGHIATLVITNAKGDDLGWSPLSRDRPVFQIALPPATPAKPAPKK